MELDTIFLQKPKGKEYYISKKIGKAIMDYQMISEGDRILVAVSGGKDSLTLLKILRDRLRISPVKYELLAVHITPNKDYLIDPEILREYFEDNHYSYHIERIDFKNDKSDNTINCFWCSWNRRKALFQLAEKFGFNKIALGHHLDDIVQTIVLNLFFNGEISCMLPKQELFKGKLTIIRPLAYVQEKEIVSFAKTQNFPFRSRPCPDASKSKRTYVASLLNELERLNPYVKRNIFRALKRIREDYLP